MITAYPHPHSLLQGNIFALVPHTRINRIRQLRHSRMHVVRRSSRAFLSIYSLRNLMPFESLTHTRATGSIFVDEQLHVLVQSAITESQRVRVANVSVSLLSSFSNCNRFLREARTSRLACGSRAIKSETGPNEKPQAHTMTLMKRRSSAVTSVIRCKLCYFHVRKAEN